MWKSRLYGSERGWSATLIWMKYGGTANKPGGKQRKQTLSFCQGSLRPTRTRDPAETRVRLQDGVNEIVQKDIESGVDQGGVTASHQIGSA